LLSIKYPDKISGLQILQLIRFGTLLLISVVFAKSSVTTESIGKYEIFLFISALLTSFWINGIIQSFLPLYRNNKTFISSRAGSPEIFNAFILISMLTVLTIIVLILFKGNISKIINSDGSLPWFNLILIYIFFSSPSFLVEYIFLLKDEGKRMFTYAVATFSVQLIMVSLPALLSGNMEFSIKGLVAVSVIRYIWLITLLIKYSLPVISINFIKEHIYFAFPLIISALLGSSAHYVDGFLVLNKYDAATFALFSYGAKEFPLTLLMANALSTAMIPEFSEKRYLNHSLKTLKKRSAQLMHTLFPVTIVFLLSSEWLYPKIFNENFTGSAVIFNIYLLLIISRLVLPHTIITGMKKTKVIMYASVAELTVNISLSILFINLWGIEGVAFATIIAYAVQKIIWVMYNKIVLGIPPVKYIPVTILGIYTFFTLTVFYFMY
jgi:O-antigen/teichoic acid export membrane protein